MRRNLVHLSSAIMILCVASATYAQTNYDTSPSAQTGVQVFGSYFASNLDTVGVYNGNLVLSIPLFSIPGRELPYELKLTYNAAKWESDSINFDTVGRYTGGWIKSNLFGKKEEPSFFVESIDSIPYCYVYWIDGAGTKHKYVPQSGDTWCSMSLLNYPSLWNSHTLKSADSDGSTLWTGEYRTDGSDTARINFKNGHILYFRTAHSSATYDYVTPNGNYLVKATNDSGLPTQDTLGRAVGYSCSGCGTSSWTETYTVKDSSGTDRTYVLSWTKATSWGGTNFVDPFLYNHPAVQITMLNSITLPNSKTYSFEYDNTHGMLTKVTLPSGAYITYIYSTSPFTTSAALERVTERRVNVDASNVQVWQYTAATSPSQKVTITSPEGDKVVHFLSAQGEELSTEWQTSTNIVLKKIENTWTQDYIAVNGQAINGRVTTSKTYLNGTLSSTTDLAYDTSNMNLLQEKVTEGTGAFGQIKNQKDITYQTISGNFTVPSQETLTAIDPATGNFVLQGKMIYSYDEYTLTVSVRSRRPIQTQSEGFKSL